MTHTYIYWYSFFFRVSPRMGLKLFFNWWRFGGVTSAILRSVVYSHSFPVWFPVLRCNRSRYWRYLNIMFSVQNWFPRGVQVVGPICISNASVTIVWYHRNRWCVTLLSYVALVMKFVLISVNFNVVSLHTYVLTEETLKISKKKFKSPGYLMVQTKHFVKNTYLLHLTVQTNRKNSDGLLMSQVLANLFMEDLGVRAIEFASLKPPIWVWYVDDSLVIWRPEKKD